jgi:universal stress protein E
MPNFNRILVAVKELDAKAHPSVLKAAQLARACGAEVELFHGLTTPVYTDFAAFSGQGLLGYEADLRRRAVRRLETIADGLRRHSLKVSVAAEWDFPGYEAIIRRALKIKADLIVASRHTGHHRAPWLLRLTDWELVRLSPVPVLLIKNPHAYRRPAILVAVDPTHAFAKPLQLDKRLLETGSLLSQQLRGNLHAVHAYARLPLQSLQTEGMNADILEKIEAQAERSAATSFKHVLRATSIAPSRRYLIGRHPVDAISEAAKKSRCGIVVMGAISRTGLKSLLIGNTAERIFDELSCDILVVKPRAFVSRVSRATRGPRLMMSSPAGNFGYY